MFHFLRFVLRTTRVLLLNLHAKKQSTGSLWYVNGLPNHSSSIWHLWTYFKLDDVYPLLACQLVNNMKKQYLRKIVCTAAKKQTGQKTIYVATVYNDPRVYKRFSWTSLFLQPWFTYNNRHVTIGSMLELPGWNCLERELNILRA